MLPLNQCAPTCDPRTTSTNMKFYSPSVRRLNMCQNVTRLVVPLFLILPQLILKEEHNNVGISADSFTSYRFPSHDHLYQNYLHTEASDCMAQGIITLELPVPTQGQRSRVFKSLLKARLSSYMHRCFILTHISSPFVSVLLGYT